MTPTRGVVALRRRSALTLTLVSTAGLVAFIWPLIITPTPGLGHAQDAPWIFLVMVPLLVVVAVAELSRDPLDTKALAMIAVLAGLGAALRPLGAGTAGVELVFFLLILGGRVMGPAFGFLLGTSTLFASALLTAGIGPWLPFQMLAAGWIGLGAALLPPVRGRIEIALLIGYGIVTAYLFGFIMNLWFWPFVTGSDTSVSYVAGDPITENLRRFVAFHVVSSLGWDTGRAITTSVLLAIVGPGLLSILRRARRRAAFDVPVEFTSPA